MSTPPRLQLPVWSEDRCVAAAGVHFLSHKHTHLFISDSNLIIQEEYFDNEKLEDAFLCEEITSALFDAIVVIFCTKAQEVLKNGQRHPKNVSKRPFCYGHHKSERF